MKLLLCSNVRLNAECLESLDIKLSHKWKANLSEKFADLFDQSLQKHCSYIFLCGRIFGTERITEEVIDNLFKIIKSNKNTNVLMFLAINEYNRISYRNDIPENLHLLCIGSADSYVDDEIALMIDKNTVRIQLSDLDEISIQKREENNFVLCSAEGEQNIASFEPIGFDDIQDTEYGYSILEWDKEKIKSFTNVHMQKYAYKSVSLKILPTDTEKDILKKLLAIIKPLDYDTFLRITVVGRSEFGLTIDVDYIANQLRNKLFWVEIFDNTIMDIEEESFENDISLRSEFVRLTLKDASLSESERNRIISCGWNALNGKEVPTE